MTSSDDMLLNSAYWHPHLEKEHLIRQQLLILVQVYRRHHPNTMPPWPDNPESVTEPESDPPQQVVTAPPHPDDLDSITEPESDPLPPQATAPPHMDDPESITEPESDPPEPTITSTPKAAITKWKSIFATPSPPPPGSIYWKYVSREEDKAWYDQSRSDKDFLVPPGKTTKGCEADDRTILVGRGLHLRQEIRVPSMSPS
ncbi:hypothetical protein DFH29DRAFT_881422 [Suillus ampliporus]|nr:hypothetical protein DFH29DRAFT_881422 [Suillus ampliporus]